MALQEYYPDPEKSVWRRLLYVVLILGGVGVLWGGLYLIKEFKPGKEKSIHHLMQDKKVAADPAWLEKSKALTAQFDAIQYTREVTESDIELLAEAVRLREQYFGLVPLNSVTDLQETERLKRRWHDAVAEPLRKQAIALAEESHGLAKQHNYEGARLKMEAARDLMNHVNQEWGSSVFTSTELYTRYERRVRELEAIPIYEQSLALEAEAKEHETNEQWSDALQKMQKALELQNQLVTHYLGFSQADVSRMKTLESLLSSYDSLELYQQVNQLISQAEQAQKQGNIEESARLFEAARREQQALNEQFPGSRFASAERISSLGRRAQTVLSQNNAQPIRDTLQVLNRALLAQDAPAAQALIPDLVREIDTFHRQFPRSAALPEDSRDKIAFLSIIQNDLDALFQNLKTHLSPVPASSAKFYNQLVDQDLFRRITGKNPSRERGDERPVDSVNLLEIELFMTRLTWLVGMPVRLPHVSELIEVQHLRGNPPSEFEWSEWCRNAEDAYGSLAWSANHRNSFKKQTPTERSRAQGFRFVIEGAGF